MILEYTTVIFYYDHLQVL